jgi:peptidoglycan/LPS O-acetylase OafA/YrhL
MDATTLVLRFSVCSWFFGTLLLVAITAAPGGRAARFWEAPFLRFFGKYSYGLYVFHYPLLPVFKHLFPVAGLAEVLGSAILGRLLFILLATGSSLTVAMLSWHCYEKHFVKLKDVLTDPKSKVWKPRTASPCTSGT